MASTQVKSTTEKSATKYNRNAVKHYRWQMLFIFVLLFGLFNCGTAFARADMRGAGGLSDLSIAVDDGVFSIAPDATFAYTVTISNAEFAFGFGGALDVTVDINLDSNLTIISSSGCGEDPTASTVCTLGFVPDGGSVSFTLAVAENNSGATELSSLFTAVAGIDTPDNNQNNNTAVVTTPIETAPQQGSLEITALLDTSNGLLNPDGYVPGSLFDYSLDCEGTAFDQSFQLPAAIDAPTAANQLVVGGLPSGILCGVVRTATPALLPGFLHVDPIEVSSNQPIQFNSSLLQTQVAAGPTVTALNLNNQVSTAPVCDLVVDDYQVSAFNPASNGEATVVGALGVLDQGGSGVLGGFRDLFASAFGPPIGFGFADGSLIYQSDPGADGVIDIIYDAAGAGLGGIDLSNLNTFAIEFLSAASIAGATFTITLESSGVFATSNPQSIPSLSFIGSDNPDAAFVPFSEFPDIGTLDLTSIESIQFVLDGVGSLNAAIGAVSICGPDELGDINVVQSISGETDAYVPGSLFDFELDCSIDNFDASFQLADGETFALTGIPEGVQCSLTQVAAPAAVPNFSIEPAVIDPPTVVTVAGEQTVINVTNNIIGISDLAVSIVASPEPVIAGQTLTYTVTVDNLGPVDAVNVAVNSDLVEALTQRGMAVSTSGCTEDPNGTPDCSLGDLAVGNQAQYTISVPIDPASLGSIDNTVTVSSDSMDPIDPNNVATISTDIVASADLGLTKVDDIDPIDAGQTLTYTVTVTNNGPSVATGIAVTDTLPAGVSLLSTSGCAEDPTGVPTCSLPDLTPTAQASYSIEVAVAEETVGTITNSASVAATTPDADTGNNTSSEDTLVNAIEADLALSKQSVTEFAVPLQPVVFSLTVENLGPGLAENVVITDVLPGGLQLTSTQGCVNDPQGLPSCAVGDLAAGERVTVLVNTVVEEGSRAAITNTASVLSDTDDPDLGNNQDSASLTVFIPVPALNDTGLIFLLFSMLLIATSSLQRRLTY